MASAYENVHLPRGYTLAVQTDPTVPDVYTDLGVTYDDGNVNYTYDVQSWTGSQAEGIIKIKTNEQIEVTGTLVQIELSNLAKLMSGTATYASVAGTLVTGASQVVASGAWAYKKFIKITNQNGDLSAISVTSVTAGTDGLLVANTDYYVGKNDQGESGIFVIDSVTVTTEAQTITIVYDYTPSASRTLSAGALSSEITTRSFRIRKNLGTVASPKWFSIVVYSAVAEGGFQIPFPRFDTDAPTTLPLSIIGRVDTTRGDFDQLFKITDEYGIQDN